jgi:PAN domain
MPKAERVGAWILLVGVALATQGCWEEGSGGLALLGDGGCRLASGSEGTPTTISVASPDECQAQCLAGETSCVAVEYNANNSMCEIHREPITRFEKIEGVSCYVMR